MNDPQQVSPRQRMQALLAIPDSQRTDEQWDELNELEIMLAPVNREGAPEPGARRRPSSGQSGQPGQAKPSGGGAGGGAGEPGRKPFRKTLRRPRKPKPAA